MKFFLSGFLVVSMTPEQMDSLRDDFDDYKTLTYDEVRIEWTLNTSGYMWRTMKRKDYRMNKVWANIGKLQLPIAVAQSESFPLLL